MVSGSELDVVGTSALSAARALRECRAWWVRSRIPTEGERRKALWLTLSGYQKRTSRKGRVGRKEKEKGKGEKKKGRRV